LLYNALVEKSTYIQFESYFYVKSLRVPALMPSNDDPLEGGGPPGYESQVPKNQKYASMKHNLTHI
jgi:hypothetical protein